MKKVALVILLVIGLAAIACAEGEVFSAMGRLESKDYTLTSDNAITLEAAWVAAGNAWKKNGQAPKAMTIQPETYGLRIGFGGDTPSVDNVGTVITAGSTGRWANPSVQDAKICNSTAGSNAKVHMIVERER
ncbi:MAG: hypothetical protein WCV62_05710 [Candidatus Peribacteraceae bacterium]|jgi:hypothetical protein